METQKIKVIGVIMTYNSAPMLENLWQRIPADALDDILLVDDGSTDNSMDEARRLGIKAYWHEHLGYGGNLRAGLQKALEAGADAAIEIHGDGQFDPSVIPHAIEKLREGADFVIGSRFTNLRQPLHDGMPLSRYLANIGLSLIDRLVLRVPLSEFHTGFRAYSRKLMETVGLDKGSNDYLYSFEIIAMARFHGLAFREISVRADYHKEHTSVSIGRSIRYALQTRRTLLQYLSARWGIKKSRLFS